MALACGHEVESWTLGGLVGAFLNLALTYFLLCVSAIVFFASKFLKIFWLSVPCPCHGFLGYRNRDLCLLKLLVGGPVATIHAVHKLVKSKFPFDVLWSEDQRCNMNRKLIRDVNCGKNGVHELEADAFSSPYSSPRLQSLVDRESGYDAKGKRIMMLKKRPGIRRSRRAVIEYRKLPSFLLSDSLMSVARVFPFPSDDGDTRGTSGESSIPIAGREDGRQDDEKALTEDDMGEKMCKSSKLSGSVGENKDVNITYAQEKAPIVGNEIQTIKMLQEALEKEKATCAALNLELEKERAAAATAADEAMAMIFRLQKDKASIEMEVRQYQRMIEEKFVYDEEEMDVLKEILLRREKENHFLEKEVEAYRHMSLLGNERSNGDLTGQKPSLSLNSNAASFDEKQIHPNGHDSLEKYVLSEGKGKVHMDNSLCQGMNTEAQGIEKNLYCDEEERQQSGDLRRNLHSSMLDTEPAVHDVHVIDGETELWKEESRSSIYTALDRSQDFVPTFGASGVRSSELLQAFPSTSWVDTEPKINSSSLDICCGLPIVDNS